MQGACKVLLGRYLEVMYVYPFSPRYPQRGRQSIRGNMLSIRKEPPLPERENVHTKMLHLVNQNRKTYQTERKKKKRPERQCNTRGNILACPKKNPKKDYPEEEITKVRDQRAIQLEAKGSHHKNGWMMMMMIIVTGRRS